MRIGCFPIVCVAVLVGIGASRPATAEETLFDSIVTAVRTRLEREIVDEMRSHNSEATAWYNDKSVDKQKWTKGKLLGKPIRLASWTEETKSWVWLEDADRRHTFELRRLEVRDARVEFSVMTRALARFKVYHRVPKLMKGAVGGNMDIELVIDGSAAMAKGGLADAKITNFDGRIHDLRFNNDLAHVWEDVAKDMLNSYIRKNDAKLTQSIEKAINRVKF